MALVNIKVAINRNLSIVSPFKRDAILHGIPLTHNGRLPYIVPIMSVL